MGIEFVADEFDFEEALKKIENEVVSPNILLCGATGVGKSSLVNDIFGEEVAQVGEGVPITSGVNLYKCKTVNLYDSEGYEIGEEKQSYYQDSILACIDKYKEEYPEDLNKHIHEVWYCISAANKRITETDISIINQIKNKKVPLAIVFTQIDSVDEDELKALINVCGQECQGSDYFTYCVTDNAEMKVLLKNYIQKDALVKWAIDVLPGVLKEGLVIALAGCIKQKRELVKNKIIPKYIALAATVALSPIPFSDAVLLTPIQLDMCVRIFHIYGLSKLKGGIATVLQSTIVSQIGKKLATTLVGNLVKLLPAMGTAIGIGINTVVASSLTTILGTTISIMCYNYSKEVLKGHSVDVAEFFSSEIFNEIFNSVLKREQNK